MSFSIRRSAALQEIESWGYFQSVRWIESTDSTNRQLASELRNGEVLPPSLLITSHQSSGKGRGTNRWFSPTGCLMFSMAVPFQPRTLELLPLEVGVVMAKSIAPLCRSSPQVKWPNDVHVAGKKICGILIEVIQIPFEPYSAAIIGVGINCQVDFSEADASVRELATSLHLQTRDKQLDATSPEDVLVGFLQCWLEAEAIRKEVPDWLVRDWKDWSLLQNKWVSIEDSRSTNDGKRVEGLCLGIDHRGALLVALPTGEAVPIIAGSVASFRDA